MACRCSDMSECMTKINRLSGALNTFRSIDSKISAIDQSLASLSNTYEGAFKCDNNANLKQETLDLDGDLGAARGQVVSKINSVLSDLREDYKKMHAEDEAFHAEEDEDD